MAELTQAERDRLAEWMGWELKPIVSTEFPSLDFEAWYKGDEFITIQLHWLYKPNWEHAGMLLEKAREGKVVYTIEAPAHCVAVTLIRKFKSPIYTSHESDAPLAICRAILAMLEAEAPEPVTEPNDCGHNEQLG